MGSDASKAEMNRRISDRVREHMKARLMTNKALALKLGIKEYELSKKLNSRPWTRASLLPVANALDCDIERLMDDSIDLPPWSYDENLKPVRLGDTVVDEVYLLVGNHTETIEISPRYRHEFPALPADIDLIKEELTDRASQAAAARGVPYYNGPAVRLISASESENYQALDGREIKRVVLELGPLPWYTHMVLNGFLDDPTVFPNEELKTIRERYGDPESVYKYGPDLSWCHLSRIFTVLLTPITTDGYGVVQLRSKAGVGFAAGLFISGVSENMHRYADEGMPDDVGRRRNPLRGDGRKRVDHLYPPEGVPSPLLTAMRGLYEEVSQSLGEQLETAPNRFVFLNMIFGFPHFHPFLVGVVELPYTRAQTEQRMQESPGKDHGEGTPYFFKLDSRDTATAKLIAEKERWYAPGLSAFITSILYWEQRHLEIRKSAD